MKRLHALATLLSSTLVLVVFVRRHSVYATKGSLHVEPPPGVPSVARGGIMVARSASDWPCAIKLSGAPKKMVTWFSVLPKLPSHGHLFLARNMTDQSSFNKFQLLAGVVGVVPAISLVAGHVRRRATAFLSKNKRSILVAGGSGAAQFSASRSKRQKTLGTGRKTFRGSSRRLPRRLVHRRARARRRAISRRRPSRRFRRRRASSRRRFRRR